MVANKKTGIIGAMPEEIDAVANLLEERTEETIGMRTYYSGIINGVATVVVFCRWGKVAAATTVSTLIHRFGITDLIFTGVAGAINSALRIGDIVIGARLIQHDMDARPLMPQYQIPLLGKDFFEIENENINRMADIIGSAIKENKFLLGSTDLAKQFNITHPKIFIGDIASGDQFISGSAQRTKIISQLPSVLCVEMEGAAVAQVCYENAIPFVVIRVISDAADEESEMDFPLFIKEVASLYSLQIIKAIYGLK